MSFGFPGRFQRRRESEYDREPRLSKTSVYTCPTVFEPGTGAEFMARSGWNQRSCYKNGTNTTPITFYGASWSKRILTGTVVILAILLIVFIVTTITLFALKVIIINYRHEEISATTPNVLSSQYPRVPSNMLPPPVDLLQSRTFLLDLQVLSQANSAYDNPSNYEYQRASQMILIAMRNLLKRSTLNYYMRDIIMRNIENSGNDLLVRFVLELSVPSGLQINPDIIKNVILSEISQFERQLNGIEVDRKLVISELF
ncbi:unnamed protein product [Dracunculus medinensis]|uniref:SEA domain-containing protein n=1 Tax=Dracunculus medinensis TaxID=318479 RepID=A0A0N4U0E1_DRAME|nr:unnamed protein product [Dracunculus medinensis]